MSVNSFDIFVINLKKIFLKKNILKIILEITGLKIIHL